MVFRQAGAFAYGNVQLAILDGLVRDNGSSANPQVKAAVCLGTPILKTGKLVLMYSVSILTEITI